MCPNIFPGCCSFGHHCSHNASILTCACTARPSRTWSTSEGMFHRTLLKAATLRRYIVLNMCSNRWICPLRLIFYCVVWDDDERKGEGETRCRLIACSSRKAPGGPPGLTSLSDGRITINSIVCLLNIHTAEGFGI